MLKKQLKIRMVVSSFIFAVAAFSLVAVSPASAQRPGTSNGTIAGIALNNPNFSVLVQALSCTNLVGLVDGNRQLTVFAPTNAAFSKLNLDESNVCDTPGLAHILAYHVTPGIKGSQNVLSRSSMNMLNGERAPIQGATIGGASLNTSLLNIRATNGMVHVLNDVMLP